MTRRRLGLVLTLSMFIPVIVGAQTPWTVTVTPTMNPLPIGFCGRVQLTVLDPNKSNEVARNPLGGLVTIADFDMVVTSPDGKSVAGQSIDVSNWNVCACQGATVGTVATITATYPAQLLRVPARVPGVAFQTTATFALGASKGTSNPSACAAPPPTAAIAVAPLAVAAPAPAAAPPPPPAPVALPYQPAVQPRVAVAYVPPAPPPPPPPPSPTARASSAARARCTPDDTPRCSCS